MSASAVSIDSVITLLEASAPTTLAESWDNTGLLIGDRSRSVERIITCLTLTEDVAREAIAERANLIITHHPLPFKPVVTITADSLEGQILLSLIEAKIAVYSGHTAFDSAREGINEQIARGLELTSVAPLVPSANDATIGAGRFGSLRRPTTLAEFVELAKRYFKTPGVHCVGEPNANVSRVAVACGSGGSFLDAAVEHGCDCLVTGEIRFHGALEARARSISLILPGHYASERHGLEWLAERLSAAFSSVQTWASRSERDPLRWQ